MKTNEMKVVLIVAVSIVLAVVSGITMVNPKVNSKNQVITQNDVRDQIIEDMNDQVLSLKNKYGFNDLELVITIDKIEIEKPTLFKDGRVDVEITDYLKSSEFKELENCDFDEATFDWYLEISKELDYWGVSIEGYQTSVQKSFMSTETRFFDSNDNGFRFYCHYAVDGIPKISKNGDIVYRGESRNPNAGKETCYRCYGTGRVKLQYGNSWNDKPGLKYGSKCGACGGTGYEPDTGYYN